ncbi:MAG: hypothetical protein ACQEQ4_04615 [Fibrobacterota bacterium]
MKSPIFSPAWREECCAWACVYSALLCFFLALFILPLPPFREDSIIRLRYSLFMGDIFFEIFACILLAAILFSLAAAVHQGSLRYLWIAGVCILWFFTAGRVFFGRLYSGDSVAGALFPPLDDRLVYTHLAFWVVHTAVIPALILKSIPSLNIRDDAVFSGYRLFLLMVSITFFSVILLRPRISFAAALEYSASVPVFIFPLVFALSALAVMIRRVLR